MKNFNTQLNPESEDSIFLTPRQMANILNMSLKWVVKQTQERRMPGQTKIGRLWRYHISEVEDRLNAGGQFLLDKPHAR